MSVFCMSSMFRSLQIMLARSGTYRTLSLGTSSCPNSWPTLSTPGSGVVQQQVKLKLVLQLQMVPFDAPKISSTSASIDDLPNRAAQKRTQATTNIFSEVNDFISRQSAPRSCLRVNRGLTQKETSPRTKAAPAYSQLLSISTQSP